MTAGFAAILAALTGAALLGALGKQLDFAAANGARRVAREPRQAIEPIWTALVRGL